MYIRVIMHEHISLEYVGFVIICYVQSCEKFRTCLGIKSWQVLSGVTNITLLA